ncbi:Protein of unknown function [Bacillus cereus]|nr:Protein of unknown function [Bacillus cereus]
MKIIDLETERK